MESIAPGKLILSGEHAVVHGNPAIAMAVDRYASTTVGQEESDLVSFNLFDLKYHKSMTLHSLKKLKTRLKEDFSAFKKGEFGIKEVIKRPFELSQYALSSIFEKLTMQQKSGLHLTSHSQIPIGCGMGSSAATILTTLHAIAQYHKLHLSPEKILELALDAENMQHGKSSGLDLQTSLYGGCILLHDEGIKKLPLLQGPLFLINTGKPEATTGECVEACQSHFVDPGLCAAFRECTERLELALRNNDRQDIKEIFQTNQTLLERIGVIPASVKQFIQQLTIEQNTAVKLCGAGTIRGEKAGVLLAICDEAPQALCQQYGYQWEAIKGEAHGLRSKDC